MSVIVAVRVRPFNQREQKLKSKLCIKMKTNQTILLDEQNQKRTFAFDYSFWSHDNFKTNDEGYFEPTTDKYADQQHVYDTVGKQVLRNALDGYHCCLFAYGQTGSGKSYSMIGYGANRGIVPIISEEIFNLIDEQTTKKKWYEVNVSMCEIYNEKIQDLLIPVDQRPHEGLKVRQSKTLGVYVENLSKHPVDSYKGIEQKMSQGNHNRTIASTQMNACSSRAHTIITIEFKQIEIMQGKKVQRFSCINLVDLAGSEKISKTGASGDRLKEGCSINQSLTVLGKVISNLADKAMGKGIKTVVPYRESSLTRILQNALGGNSKTLMICAISPSNNNYDETLSTLRYADRAKKIQCHAVINESETDKKLRELQTENDKLKEILKKLQIGDIKDLNKLESLPNTGVGIPDEETKKKEEEMSKKIKDLEETLKAHNLVMQEYEKSFEERLKEEKMNQSHHEEADLQSVHLININEDPQLSFKIYHNLEKNTVLKVGRGNKDLKPDIVLKGIGMQVLHATIMKQGDDYVLIPENEKATEFLFLNGEQVVKSEILHHWDRIAFGFNSIFLFKNPHENTQPRNFDGTEELDWEKCQQEITKSIQHPNIGQFQEGLQNNAKKLYEQESKRIQEEYQNMMKQMQEEHENKIQKMQDELNNTSSTFDEDAINFELQQFEEYKKIQEQNYQRQLELEKQKKDELEKEYMKNFDEKDKKKLEEKMYKINPNVIEANLIAKELGRSISFKLYISFSYLDVEDISNIENKKKVRTKVQVINNEKGYQYFWDIEKFSNRFQMIKELLDQYYLTNEIPKLEDNDDPFWDPEEPQVIGEGFVKLMSLAYLLNNATNLVIVGDKGSVATVEVQLVPLDENLQEITEDDDIFDEFIDDPSFLFGKKINFLMCIENVTLQTEEFKDIYINYSIKFADKEDEGKMKDYMFQTGIISGKGVQDNFSYQKYHCYEEFNQQILNYLLKCNMCLELKGFPKQKPQIQEVKQTKPEITQNQKKPVRSNKDIPVMSQQTNKEINEYNKNLIMKEKKQRIDKQNEENKRKKKKKEKNCCLQ